MSQEIKHIPLTELYLWSENPRKPLVSDASNEVIIRDALSDELKWNLKSLAREMGPVYDLSELPTVVEVDNRFVVFDGNRRVAIAMLSNNIVNIEHKLKLPACDLVLPCNLCALKTAVDNIIRKHSENGSWLPLERDLFIEEYKKETSLFLQFEKQTSAISKHPKLNQGFVKKEVLTDKNLKDIGLIYVGGEFKCNFDYYEQFIVVNDIIKIINTEEKTTRKNRKTILLDLVSEEVKNIMNTRDRNVWYTLAPKEGKTDEITIASTNESSKVQANVSEHDFSKYENPNSHSSNINPQQPSDIQAIPNNLETSPKSEILEDQSAKYPSNDLISLGSKYHTKRTAPNTHRLFDLKLILKSGEVNNLYRDLLELYKFSENMEKDLSGSFHRLIRMALRLLIELAAKELRPELEILPYCELYFSDAKKLLTKDQKTTLSTQEISSASKIATLLHVGAHNYTACNNKEQTLALSIIVGAMLQKSHGK